MSINTLQEGALCDWSICEKSWPYLWNEQTHRTDTVWLMDSPCSEATLVDVRVSFGGRPFLNRKLRSRITPITKLCGGSGVNTC